MSVAGTRSNRGDAYQVAVALREIVHLLSDPEKAWLEIDSTAVMANGTPITVDDVVIGYKDGRIECIQCKKNQSDFKSWTFGDLEDELEKAATLLAVESKASVRFYSRADFGKLAKLREKAAEVGNEGAFNLNVGQDLQPTLTSLAALLSNISGAPSPFYFLRRVRFTPTAEIEDIKQDARLLLRACVSRESTAFLALWHALDTAGANVGEDSTAPPSSRFSPDSVAELLAGEGCAITSSKDLVAVEKELRSVSAIGRQWQRETGGLQFDREALATLRGHVAAKASTVLLTDGPGAGKTCVLLSLMEELEKDPTHLSVFLQAREFSDATTPNAREALGFPKDLFALVSVASEHKHVVVIIDSLDVLSIARENESLKFFLSIIDRLAQIPNVTIVAACRSFDLHYNHRLKSRTWSARVEVGNLNWDLVVKPALLSWGVVCDNLDAATCVLLSNPRNLALYREIVERGVVNNSVTPQELTEHYLDTVVASDERLGDAAMKGIEEMALEMLKERRLDVDRRRIELDDETLQALLSARVLFSGRPGWCGFGHQTLLDALAVRDARRKGLRLLEFIQALPPVPFVRPAVRAFFSHLHQSDKREFRSQIRQVFDADVAFHLKRLLAESMAEIEPISDDWPLIRHLYQNHDRVFRSLYSAARSVTWMPFFGERLVPIWENEQNTSWLEIHIRRVSVWIGEDEDAVIGLWMRAIDAHWVNEADMRRLISFQLQTAELPHWEKLLPLLRKLCELDSADYDFLGRAIEKIVTKTGRGDEILWSYIVQGITDDALQNWRFDAAVKIEHAFDDKLFIGERFKASEQMLNEGVSALERWSLVWSRYVEAVDGPTPPRNQRFLDLTSHDDAHSHDDAPFTSGGEILVRGIESAIRSHAESDTAWWKENSKRVCENVCGGLRYIGTTALAKFPTGNEELIRELLSHPEFYLDFDEFELGNFIRSTAFLVPDLAEAIEAGIRARCDTYLPDAAEYSRAQRLALFSCIPSHMRSASICSELEPLYELQAAPVRIPRIRRTAGWVRPPVFTADFLQLADDPLLRLLQGVVGIGEHRVESERLVGGLTSLIGELRAAATKQPERFMNFLLSRWRLLDGRYREAIFYGVAMYLQQERGILAKENSEPPPVHTDCVALALQVLEELERHPLYWQQKRAGVEALEGCAHCLALDEHAAARMLFWAAGLLVGSVAAPSWAEDEDLETAGLNSTRGQIAESVMVIATKQLEADMELAPLVMPLLVKFSIDPVPAVRVMLLRRLAYFLHKRPDAWFLLENVVSCGDAKVWKSAEPCLYHSYRERFSDVQPMLSAMLQSEVPSALEAWARISALASLSGLVDVNALNADLARLEVTEAWRGANQVWLANSRRADLRAPCLQGMGAALESSAGVGSVLQGLSQLFLPEKGEGVARLPAQTLRRALERARETGGQVNLYGLQKWCSALADLEPLEALAVMEVVAEFGHLPQFFYDGPEALPSLLTTLFREAEECESSDAGSMLRRVIALQDSLLETNFESLDQWLRAAERKES